jgi:hypothetical protein
MGAPPDAPPVSGGACDYTPKPNALGLEPAIPEDRPQGPGPMRRQGPSSGYSYGITEVKFVPGAPDEFIVLRKLGAVYHYKLDGEGREQRHPGATFNVPMIRPAQQRQRHRSAVGGVRSGLHHEQVRLLRVRRCGRRPHVRHHPGSNYENGAITNPQRIIEFPTDTAGALYHSIGSIGFDKDGNLWGLHGDWNIGNTPARDLNSPLGKLIASFPAAAPPPVATNRPPETPTSPIPSRSRPSTPTASAPPGVGP